jgi:sulfite exporter TauE/SafE
VNASVPDLSLVAAFLAGLTGSAHCFAMCGGIASALGMHARAGGGIARASSIASLYQFGRTAGYALAGTLAGFIGARIATVLDFVKLAGVLRLASALLIVLLGVRLLVRWNALQWIEQLGARFWMKLRPLVQLAGTRAGIAKPLALGLLWSLLPCGLIYSMLMLAALSAEPGRGALIMLTFGLGTLPSMLSVSLLAARLQGSVSRPAVRIASGALLVLLGTWMAIASLSHSHHAAPPEHSPEHAHAGHSPTAPAMPETSQRPATDPHRDHH